MEALARLVRMSLRGRRLLGTALFVGVVTLASAAFVAGIESRQDAGRLWDAAFDRALGPHVTLTTNDDEDGSAPGMIRTCALRIRRPLLYPD